MAFRTNKLASQSRDFLRQGGVRQSFLMGLCLIILYHLVFCPLLNVSALAAVKSALMQMLGTLLPGTALYVILYRKQQTVFGAMAISYALGYAFNILSYFFFVPSGASSLIPVYVAVVAILSAVVVRKQGKAVTVTPFERWETLFGLVFLGYLFLQTVVYSGINIPLGRVSNVWYPTDLMFWVENAAALAREFPPTNPRVFVGATMYYHYFSSIQLAFSHLTTGIDIFTLAVPLFSLGKSILFFGTFYVLFTGLLKNRWMQLFSLLVLLFSNGLDYDAGITYVSHTWTTPFGFDIGFAFAALFLHCFYLQYDSDRFDSRAFLLSLLTFAVATGGKAPVAVVVIVAAGIVCFAWLFQKKFHLAFSYGIALLAVFFLISVGCVGLFVVEGSERVGMLSLTHYIEVSPLFSTALERLGSVLPRPVLLVLFPLAYMIALQPLVMVLFLLGGVSLLKKGDMHSSRSLGLLLSGFFGLFLGIFTVQEGQSQMYFLMAALIPCALLGLLWLDTRGAHFSLKGKRLSAAFCACALLVQMVFLGFFSYTYWGNGLLRGLYWGGRYMFFPEILPAVLTQDGLQSEDLEALAWVRDNTPTDSVLLADRSVVGELPHYMVYGAFSQRQMYLEGDVYSRNAYPQEREHLREITRQVYQNSVQALQTAAAEGVDYVIQTKWLTPDFAPDAELAALVHESESIRVYEVLGSA